MRLVIGENEALQSLQWGHSGAQHTDWLIACGAACGAAYGASCGNQAIKARGILRDPDVLID